ncbi:MAG TPA: hypothetical protein V6D20_07845 [Candidatus Obscuribacterales bacterium]
MLLVRWGTAEEFSTHDNAQREYVRFFVILSVVLHYFGGEPEWVAKVFTANNLCSD